MGIRTTYRHPFSGNVYQDRRGTWPPTATSAPVGVATVARDALAHWPLIVVSGCAGALLGYAVVGLALVLR